jgi:hypothetical protein
VTGRGVVVALRDRGIDWKNLDFRNADGSTRLAFLFDLTDDTGANASGNTYHRGTIYTRQQIDQALTGGTALATRDAVGHGTDTAAQTSDFLYYHYGSSITPFGAQTGKREIYVRLDGPAATYTVTLTGASVVGGHFDATLNPSNTVPRVLPSR